MNYEILYVELKSAYADNGPAWVGRGARSGSGRTVYFNGKALRASGGALLAGNYFDIETGDTYWVSGVRKNQNDRRCGGGRIAIDEGALEDYLRLVNRREFDSSKFYRVRLDNDFEVVKARVYALENRKQG